MPPKESGQSRRAPFVFPRSRREREREREAEAARAIPAQPLRTSAPSQPRPAQEATRTERVAPAPAACPRRKAPAQRSKKRKQVQVEESETESEEEPLRTSQESRRSGKEPTATGDKAKDAAGLLAMRMSMEKTRLGAAKGTSDLEAEVAKLKQDLQSVEAERTQAFDAANRYLNQKGATQRTVDFQKAELDRRTEERPCPQRSPGNPAERRLFSSIKEGGRGRREAEAARAIRTTAANFCAFAACPAQEATRTNGRSDLQLAPGGRLRPKGRRRGNRSRSKNLRPNPRRSPSGRDRVPEVGKSYRNWRQARTAVLDSLGVCPSTCSNRIWLLGATSWSVQRVADTATTSGHASASDQGVACDEDVHGEERLGAAKGTSDRRRGRETEAGLESVEAERTQAFDAANRYLNQRALLSEQWTSRRRSLMPHRGSQRTSKDTAASKEVGEKDQELRRPSTGQRADEDRQASSKKGLPLRPRSRRARQGRFSD
ncbi:uncharacterized protein LOC116112941 [Pistacia vera]|uniref:uncharacterized protein LOC116112941 n=1 Tax=Pistacia vera TaxID=55513 RepID=UPI0012632809|nr:uncharacterized protein LOC116112941 [Pistacia vera]